jgi:hypothetical protein
MVCAAGVRAQQSKVRARAGGHARARACVVGRAIDELDQAIDARERKEPVELRRPAHDDRATSATADPAVRFDDELSAADVDEVELAEVEDDVAGGARRAPQSRGIVARSSSPASATRPSEHRQ